MSRLRWNRTWSRATLLMTMVALLIAAVLPAGVAAASLPQTCAEVRLQNPAATDGEYTLGLQGRTARIYCADMTGTPKEYISLVNTGASVNYSFFPGSHTLHRYQAGLVVGTDAHTSYRKVRIDPATLVVDQNDVTFADLLSVGSNGYDWSNPNFNPVPRTATYATASDCYQSWSARGRGNVDLTGTDFAIDDSVTFAVGGFAPNGTVSMNPERQVVNLTGGGWCGGAGPTGPLKLKLLTPLIPVDQAPPVTTATVPAGWQNQDVTVTLLATDDESGVAVTYWELDGAPAQQGTSVLISTDGIHSLAFWSEDKAGNVEAKQSATVQIDKTAPVVAYTGNAGSYTVDQQVSIACSATDTLSGVASDSCAAIEGAAYTFALGSHSFSASATDLAGNEGSGSATFAVAVSYDSLGSLTRQFVSQGDIAGALGAKLDAAKASAARGNAKSAAGQIGAYINQVQAQSGKALTTEQAAILIQLARAL